MDTIDTFRKIVNYIEGNPKFEELNCGGMGVYQSIDRHLKFKYILQEKSSNSIEVGCLYYLFLMWVYILTPTS